jgi:hypothetical protein
MQFYALTRIVISTVSSKKRSKAQVELPRHFVVDVPMLTMVKNP